MMARECMQKTSLQIYIFSAFAAFQHISYLYIYVSIECFLILKNIPMEITFAAIFRNKKVVYVKTAHNYHIYTNVFKQRKRIMSRGAMGT